MTDLFTRLFHSSGFPSRWPCGDSTAVYAWLEIQILSDLGVGAACFAIPLLLGFFVIRRPGCAVPLGLVPFVAHISLAGAAG